MFVNFFVLVLALCHRLSAHPSDVRSDKPLFVPFHHPTVIDMTPLTYGSPDSTPWYPPQYANAYENWDPLQRQLSHQDTVKLIEALLIAGNTKKTPIRLHDHNDDDYKQTPNKLSLDEIKPDFNDLDLKFKRSLTYTSWTPPTLSSTNNLDDRVQPSASRSVPFGPYTTWLPLEAPLVGYGTGAPHQTLNAKPTKAASLKKTSRRRREIIYADKDDHLTVPPQPLFIHQDYIPVPIAYSTPIIRNVPNTEASGAPVVFPSVGQVESVGNTLFHGTFANGFRVLEPNEDLNAVAYNAIRKK